MEYRRLGEIRVGTYEIPLAHGYCIKLSNFYFLIYTVFGLVYLSYLCTPRPLSDKDDVVEFTSKARKCRTQQKRKRKDSRSRRMGKEMGMQETPSRMY